MRRRGADSAGNRKVFDSFAAVGRLYESLPDRFGASDVDHPSVSGSRRHLVVRHVAEHPAFDCELVCRRPLTVEKDEYGVAADDAADGEGRRRPEVTRGAD